MTIVWGIMVYRRHCNVMVFESFVHWTGDIVGKCGQGFKVYLRMMLNIWLDFLLDMIFLDKVWIYNRVHGAFRRNSRRSSRPVKGRFFSYRNVRIAISKYIGYAVVICKSCVSSQSEFMVLLVNDIGITLLWILFYLEQEPGLLLRVLIYGGH